MHYHALVLVSPDEEPTEELVSLRMAPHRESYIPAASGDEDDEGEITGHWDWYVIGGRWDGTLWPEKHNGHVCPSFHCPVNHSDLGRNVRPVRDIPEGVEKMVAAILTPDGRWLEGVNTYDHPEFKGFPNRDSDDGFNAAYKALSDRLDEEWRCQVRRILVEHNACTAVSVDYHS